MDENPTIDFLENCWYTCCNETTFLKKGYSARIIVPRAGSLTTFSSDFSVSSHCNLKLAVLSGVKEESKSNQHRKELAWRDEHRLLPYDESVALLACSLLSMIPACYANGTVSSTGTVRYRMIHDEILHPCYFMLAQYLWFIHEYVAHPLVSPDIKKPKNGGLSPII